MERQIDNKLNYLEIHVEINASSLWFVGLKEIMKQLNVGCKKGFHITAAFLKDDKLKDELCEVFDRTLSHRKAPRLTFNRLEAFTSMSGKEHIVCLTSSQPEVEYLALVEDLRNEALKIGADLEPYRLHVTLARVPVKIISLENLQELVAEIKLREFKLALTTIEYRYRNPDLKKGLIMSWKLKEAK